MVYYKLYFQQHDNGALNEIFRILKKYTYSNFNLLTCFLLHSLGFKDYWILSCFKFHVTQYPKYDLNNVDMHYFTEQ